MVSEGPVGQAVQAVSEGPVEQAALVVSGDPVEPAVQESPAVPVAPELEIAPVVEPGTVRVAVELEHDQVVLVLVRGHPRGQLAVPPRTKSVTAAHRHGLVPLLEAAEDLVPAAAETTRGPAAAGAAIAWEVADTVAVGEAAAAAAAAAVAVAAAAVAVVAVAEDGDKHSMRKNK